MGGFELLLVFFHQPATPTLVQAPSSPTGGWPLLLPPCHMHTSIHHKETALLTHLLNILQGSPNSLRTKPSPYQLFSYLNLLTRASLSLSNPSQLLKEHPS